MSNKARWICSALRVVLDCEMLAGGAMAPRVLADEDHDSQQFHRRGPAPKVVLISLDGAKPDLIDTYLRTRCAATRRAVSALLSRRGVVARQNVTATPSLTAVSHIAIATGSTAAHNDIPANTFHPVAAPITPSISGFRRTDRRLSTSTRSDRRPMPTAEPLWVRLREARQDGRHGDLAGRRRRRHPHQQYRRCRRRRRPASTDYTVPFGAFGGIGATGLHA